MMNQIQTVGAIFNRPPHRYSMAQIKALMRELNPLLAFTDHGPYAAVEALEAKGLVRYVPGSRPKVWVRVQPITVQSELPFGAEPDEAALLQWSRARPGTVQAATMEAVNLLSGTGEWTSLQVRNLVATQCPELYRTAARGSVGSALNDLEHRGVIQRTGRKRGAFILWRSRTASSGILEECNA